MPIARVKTKEIPSHIELSLSFEDAERLRHILEQCGGLNLSLTLSSLARSVIASLNVATTKWLLIRDGRGELLNE